jgi:hypothetical protein
MPADDFWAITSYFNPAGFQRRRDNFQRFRAALEAPLIVAEMSNSGRFEIAADDRTIVVRLSQADVMWQKESLLNVALDHLPTSAEYVAWLDCDVLFEDDDWREQARTCLGDFPLVQLFTDLHDLPPSGLREPLPALAGTSIAALNAQGAVLDSAYRPTETAQMRGSAFGLAWAARVGLMREHRFYDAMIIGGGDRSLASAALGSWKEAATLHKLMPARAAHYESWAARFYEAVRGNVGVLPGRIFHLWHGELVDRSYADRHSRFAKLPFDPAVDLVRDPGGLWKWSRERSDLTEFMAEYFASRREDGRAGA